MWKVGFYFYMFFHFVLLDNFKKSLKGNEVLQLFIVLLPVFMQYVLMFHYQKIATKTSTAFSLIPFRLDVSKWDLCHLPAFGLISQTAWETEIFPILQHHLLLRQVDFSLNEYEIY